MHLPTIAASAGDTGVPSAAIFSGAGSLYRCWVRIPMKLSASNGTAPLAISYIMTPSA